MCVSRELYHCVNIICRLIQLAKHILKRIICGSVTTGWRNTAVSHCVINWQIHLDQNGENQHSNYCSSSTPLQSCCLVTYFIIGMYVSMYINYIY